MRIVISLLKSKVFAVIICVVVALFCYVLAYVTLVKRRIFVVNFGPPIIAVFPEYSTLSNQLRVVFSPVHWIDANLIRKELWKSENVNSKQAEADLVEMYGPG